MIGNLNDVIIGIYDMVVYVLFYILNILIRSRDLECTLVFLSAMPRSATVAIIYALRLLSLHL